MISSLNEIIHNENTKPLTLNDNSIKRLKKLLNLDDFSTIKVNDQQQKKSKSENTKNLSKTSHKKKFSLSAINESSSGGFDPSAHRTDYTQIVSKVMILKKLSNNSSKLKYSSLNSKSGNSLESASRESFNDNNSSRINDLNVMKIIITERMMPMPPRTSPRTTDEEIEC